MSGELCENNEGDGDVALVVGVVVPAFVVLAVVVVLVAALLMKRRKKDTDKVELKEVSGLVGNTRFVPLRVPDSADVTPLIESTLSTTLARDAETGFAWSLRVLAGAQAAELDNVCRALLYAHHSTGHGTAFVTNEVEECGDGTRLFAAPSAAALAMRYFCRITGRKDIFSVCKRVLRELLQKDRSDRAAEKQILHDKQLSEMVDTTSISMSISAGGFTDQQTESAGGSSDFTGVDELELVVLAQELLDAVVKSAALVPTDIGEVLTHVRGPVCACRSNADVWRVCGKGSGKPRGLRPARAAATPRSAAGTGPRRCCAFPCERGPHVHKQGRGAGAVQRRQQ